MEGSKIWQGRTNRQNTVPDIIGGGGFRLELPALSDSSYSTTQQDMRASKVSHRWSMCVCVRVSGSSVGLWTGLQILWGGPVTRQESDFIPVCNC